MFELNKIMDILRCSECGGRFHIKNVNLLNCIKCSKKVYFLNGNILQFEDVSISDKIIEKTMYGPQYDELKEELNNKSHNYLIDKTKIKIKTEGILLDYGCGSSRQIFDFILQKKAKIAIGIDYDLEPLLIVSKIAKEMRISNILFIQMKGDALPFFDDTFDFISSHQALEHVPNPGTVIKELSRIIKKNSYLELDFPNGSSLGESGRRFFHWITKTNNPHISKINLKTAKKFFKKEKLEIIFLKPSQALTGPIIYLFEGLILRFIFKKYKIWSIRKKYKSNLMFIIIGKIELFLMKIYPKFGHDYSFILKK